MLKANGMSIAQPKNPIEARLVRIVFVVFLLKSLLNRRTVTTMVLAVMPIAAKRKRKTPKNILADVEISFSI